MNSHNSTVTKSRTKTLFVDVMQMKPEERKQFIERNSPNMQEWQKIQTLN